MTASYCFQTLFDILQILCGGYSSFSNVYYLSAGHENCYIDPFEKIWLCGGGVVLYIFLPLGKFLRLLENLCLKYSDTSANE
jgi:hypothetical protein